MLRCSVCTSPYVWALTWRPAEDRREWRPRPDCACDGAYGAPGPAEVIRDDYVTDDDGAVVTLARSEWVADTAAATVADDDDDTPVVEHGYHDDYVADCPLCNVGRRR